MGTVGKLMNCINIQIEQIASRVCRKISGLSGEHCYASGNQNHPVCRDYGKCRISEKSEDQLRYVLSSISECTFLEACPGSGKTEMVGVKAAYEIRDWKCNYRGIAVLTFTNNAADVIKSRIHQFTNKLRYPHYVGTIDSWLHGYTANPFGHLVTGYTGKDGDHKIRVTADTDSGAWLNSFKCPTPYIFRAYKSNDSNKFLKVPIFSNRIQFMLDASSFRILKPFSDNHEYIHDKAYFDSPMFAEYRSDKKWLTLQKFREGLKQTKLKFWQAGFATYQDIEYICYKLLSEKTTLLKRLAKRFPLIIIDECQDLSEDQLCLLNEIRDAGSVLHFVGDPKQAIYSFKGVNPEKVRGFVETNKFTKLKLSENFRSYQPIVDCCSKLIGCDDIQGVVYNGADPICICFKYEKEKEERLLRRFVEYLSEHRINISKSAILARGDSTLKRLRPGFVNRDLKPVMKPAMAIHLARAESIASQEDALKCIGSFVSEKFFPKCHADSNNYYCPQIFPSILEWRIILSQIIDSCLKHETLSNLDLAWKEWVKALNSDFSAIVEMYCRSVNCCKDIDLCVSLNLRSSSQLSNPIAEGLDTVTLHNNLGIRIGTIHKAKGETLDAVMLVSSRDKTGGTGGHWQEWLGDNDEHTRFAFVGSSRPKYLLAWAVPSPSPEDEAKLKMLGFTILEDDG